MRSFTIFSLCGFLISSPIFAGDICIDCLVEHSRIISGEHNGQIIQDGIVQDDYYWDEYGFQDPNQTMGTGNNVDSNTNIQVDFTGLECETQRIGGVCLDKK